MSFPPLPLPASPLELVLGAPAADVPTNSGIYGPDPPEIDGQHGKVAGPGLGAYGLLYPVGPRVLQPGRYYLVVRPQAGQAIGKLTVGVQPA